MFEIVIVYGVIGIYWFIRCMIVTYNVVHKWKDVLDLYKNGEIVLSITPGLYFKISTVCSLICTAIGNSVLWPVSMVGIKMQKLFDKELKKIEQESNEKLSE